MRRILFVFVDGVGLGDDDASYNALVAARLPALSALLDGRALTRDATPWHGEQASLVGLDALLGVAGTPQSGTGQSALLTGRNTARLHGRHFGPWVPTTLRELVRNESVLAVAKAARRSVAFANAYPEELTADPGAAVARRSLFLRAGPPLAALGAGIRVRGTPELRHGDAVASEITNDAWRERLGRVELPVIDAATAGRNLARIASQHDLTLFAHYSTDYAGHERNLAHAIAAIERVDAFLGGILERLDDTLLVVASDHGNLEDARHGHTLNPAICLVVGAGHAEVARGLDDLTGLAPVMLRQLDA